MSSNEIFELLSESGARRLPDPLRKLGGKAVASSEEWEQGRREEVLRLFEERVFGAGPVGRPRRIAFEVKPTEGWMGGSAVRKQVRIRSEGPGGENVVRLLLFVPVSAKERPVPAFLLINNRGSEHMDAAREKRSPFWPAEAIVARGFAAAVFDNADADPDHHDGFRDGVHGVFDPPGERPGHAWGTIAAWAWAASRAMDYLETDHHIDASKAAVVGHSRGGKTALWAGAADRRFALVVSNNSGCTGAAVSRGKGGETIRQINDRFPHWFCENYKAYNDNEYALPVDQHMLIGLIAPRHVYVASATEDLWADPESEFLGLTFASPVYRLYGMDGIAGLPMPTAEQPLHTNGMGYHLRAGGHDMTEYDWQRFMDYAERFLCD
ncbi:alpha/beta hydrolase family protein [Paenibacillus antri]|uniref:alpha/beta hydrolase family protein n=1 Tax=Paenibacillus antri TaxID=2582848 RepID=UPI001EE4AB0F|nr:acetylxylan esterase [Paenibacillus antri]